MPIAMFDSVNVDMIPADAPAVAGYVGGRWPTFSKLAARFPNAHRLSIAVSARQNADCLDIEPGDATPWDAPPWVRRQQARGIARPWLYSSVSAMQQIVNLLASSGIARCEVRLWTAHYTGRPHICGPGCAYNLATTADATQWTDKSHGRNLDESLVADGVFDLPHPLPPLQEDDMPYAIDPQTGGIWFCPPDGGVRAEAGARYLGSLPAHPEWNAGEGKPNGRAVAIGAVGDGYTVFTQDDKGEVHPYHFPGDGSLR